MKRRRRRSQSAHLSLFPFLAVLICTCGVLVVLLVLTAKNADVEARKVTEEQAENLRQEIDQLVGAVELQQERADGLRSIRNELVQRLDDVLNLRAHLENEISRLNEQAESLARRWRDLEKTPSESDDELDATIRDLRGQLVTLRDELAQKRKAQAAAPPVMYSIVPYQGSRGQSRVPVYIECAANALVIQPYQIKMEISDFALPLTEGNPLERALMTVRRYFVQTGWLESRGTPYPLLVVRPDGAEPYALARHAMKGWGDEFGYELIPQEMKLDYGEADEALQEKLRREVEAAIRHQHAIRAAQVSYPGAGRPSAVRGSGGWRADRHGGFVFQEDHLGQEDQSFSARHRGPDSIGADKKETRTTVNVGSHDHSPGGVRQQKATSETEPPDSMVGSAAAGQGTGASVDPLANRRGSDWALPNRTPGAVGYLRPIRLICTESEIILRIHDQNPTRIAFAESTESAIDGLVEQVWRIIDSWGVAGTNAFWKPEIRMSILPGGEDRAAELRQLMRGSGWKFEEEQE